MRGTVLIVTDQIYCPATSHAVPARPFGKAKTKSTADGRSSGQSVSQSVSPGIELFLGLLALCKSVY